MLENRLMLALTLLVASLAVADSVNPVTLVIAVYLASTPEPRRRLAGFAIGVFLTYLVGGAVLVLGPGELLRTAVHGSRTSGFHVASVVTGAVVIALAGVLWALRERFTRRRLPVSPPSPGSALALGAGVTVIDLPTALPYFAAIGAIVSSDAGLLGQLLLLVLFNALYVLPLAAVLAAHSVFGERSEAFLARGAT
jgi:cytochrome c biogenesis protein CcdA